MYYDWNLSQFVKKDVDYLIDPLADISNINKSHVIKTTKHSRHIVASKKNKTLSSEETNQKIYYDEIADSYDEHYASESSLKYRGDLFHRLLKSENIAHHHVLDAMCGGGQNTGYFMQQNAKVTGIDISEMQCKNYSKRYPDNTVICGSVLSNNFKDESFDFIVTDSLHHMHPYIKECMSEFNRLLKPSGKLLLWEPAAGSVFDYARQAWYKIDPRYFEENEESINLENLVRDNEDRFSLQSKIYGGSFSYIFNNLSMALRISPTKTALRYKFFHTLERAIEPFQTRLTALWFIALFEKKY